MMPSLINYHAGRAEDRGSDEEANKKKNVYDIKIRVRLYEYKIKTYYYIGFFSPRSFLFRQKKNEKTSQCAAAHVVRRVVIIIAVAKGIRRTSREISLSWACWNFTDKRAGGSDRMNVRHGGVFYILLCM